MSKLIPFPLSIMIVGSLLQVQTSGAQNFEDSLTKTQPQVLIPFELKAIRVNDQSPFAVANLDSNQINRSDKMKDIPSLLDQTPSVVINSDAGTGIGYSGMTIRGTDATRINFTLNGIPLNDGESQTTYFVDFPDLLGSTQSIQIQRGVGSSTNGAASFGASVNFSNLEQSEKPFAAFSVGAGSFKTLRTSLRAGTGRFKNGLQFDVRLSRITSDGYIERSAAHLKSLQTIAGWQSKDKRTSLKFNLLTGKEKTGEAWNGVPEDSLKTNRRYNELGLMEDGSFYKDQTDNYQQDYYQLFFDHQINDRWDIHAATFLTRGKGYYNEYKQNQTFSDYFVPDFVDGAGDTFTQTSLIRQLWLDNYFYGATYAANFKKGATQLNLGGSLTQYDGQHFGIIKWADKGFSPDTEWSRHPAHKTDFSNFLKWQQDLGNGFHLFADLQFRLLHYDLNGFRQNPDLHPKVNYFFLNPKIGLSHIADFGNNLGGKAYFSFAMAHKEPNRDDFEAGMNEIPNPEVLYDFEAGYNLKGQNWNAGVNLYYMYYHNQLVLTGKINDEGAYTRTNVARSFRRGVELMGNYRPIQMIQLHANATISQSQILDFHEFIEDYDQGGQIENTFQRTDIGFSPKFIFYGAVDFYPLYTTKIKQQLRLGINYKQVSRQFLDNTGLQQRSIQPYGVVNLDLSYAPHVNFLKEAVFVFRINNLLDKKYESNGYTYSYISGGELVTQNYYFPMAGINFSLGVDITF